MYIRMSKQNISWPIFHISSSRYKNRPCSIMHWQQCKKYWCGASLFGDIRWTSLEFMACISNRINKKSGYVIIHPCLNFNGGLSRLLTHTSVKFAQKYLYYLSNKHYKIIVIFTQASTCRRRFPFHKLYVWGKTRKHLSYFWLLDNDSEKTNAGIEVTVSWMWSASFPNI